VAVAQALATDGLPRATESYLDVYEIVDPAQFVARLGKSGYVVFGKSGLAARLCYDVATGEIVQVDSLEADNPTISSVNTNLDLFRECVKAFIDRFPYYSLESLESDEDAADAVGEELRGLFESIDPAAGDGFWFDFTYDVGMGDWATETLLEDA
jgi:hypothetical protein